ncbi:prepilin-type N-terminal cleavage/methylation domain-containing protein [Chromobacterium haemolyticum]|nr:prepilin-type N-terminal cleavage/methylation domain-containing protein [Chromobacterium haemolyticum]
MRAQAGMTLLELLAAMAVTAILAAMAWPAYQQQILRGQLAEARARLVGESPFRPALAFGKPFTVRVVAAVAEAEHERV